MDTIRDNLDKYNVLDRTKNDIVGVTTYLRDKYVEPGLILFHTVVDNKVVVINSEGEKIIEFKSCPEPYQIYRPARPGTRASILTILVSKHDKRKRVIAEINQYGEIIWKTSHRWFTHDFHILKNRHVLSVIRENRIINGVSFSDTVLVELNVKGEVTWYWSLWDNVDKLSNGKNIFNNVFSKLTDNPFHINSVQYVDDFRPDIFPEPVVVVSVRNINSILFIGRNTGKVLMEVNNLTLGQHHVRLLPSYYPGAGNIIVFDNGISFDPSIKEERKESRVIEYNLMNKRIVWKYTSPSFFSPIVGAQQRFSSGNTLITEGYYGRIFEVDYSGEVVWDYTFPEYNDLENHDKKLYEAGLRQIYRAYKVKSDWAE